MVSKAGEREVLVTSFESWTDRTVKTLRRTFNSSWHAERFKATTTAGYSSEEESYSVLVQLSRSGVDFLNDIQERLLLARAGPKPTGTPASSNKIFIGHGRSEIWRELKDFVEDLQLNWDEYNRIPTAGISTVARLQEILDDAAFALIVMTAEDEQPDGTLRPRQNVVHEAGLFQGKLGFRRAIVLREDDCAEFSNIAGLTVISFPKGKIRATFEEIRRVLKSAGTLSAAKK